MPHRDSFDALHAHEACLELRVSELEGTVEGLIVSIARKPAPDHSARKRKRASR